MVHELPGGLKQSCTSVNASEVFAILGRLQYVAWHMLALELLDPCALVAEDSPVRFRASRIKFPGAASLQELAVLPDGFANRSRRSSA